MKEEQVFVKNRMIQDTDCEVGLHRLRMQTYYPLHWHEYFELEILLSGRGVHVCNGKRTTVEAGDAWLLSFCDHHLFQSLCDTEIINISFAHGFLPKEVEAALFAGSICSKFDAGTLARVRAIGELLLGVPSEGDANAVHLRRSLVTALTVLLLQNTTSTLGKGAVPDIQAAVAYMHAHYRERLLLAQVARMHGLTPNYFGNLFMEVMGTSFREYLNRLRLRYACGLLCDTARSIKEIAYEAGYSSTEYFFGVFKKQLSITPLQYRRTAAREERSETAR